MVTFGSYIYFSFENTSINMPVFESCKVRLETYLGITIILKFVFEHIFCLLSPHEKPTSSSIVRGILR